MEADEEFRTLSELLGGDFRRMHAEFNERIGREHFKFPTPRCAPPEPPVLTRAEEQRMEERMKLFRSNDS